MGWTFYNSSGEALVQHAESEATQAEMEAETAVSHFVPPDLIHFAPSAAKAWCYSNQASPTTMLASYNMTSIADAGTGQTQYTLATDFSSANYVVLVSSNTDACHVSQNASLAAGVFDVICESFAGSGGDSEVAVACFGDQ